MGHVISDCATVSPVQHRDALRDVKIGCQKKVEVLASLFSCEEIKRVHDSSGVFHRVTL